MSSYGKTLLVVALGATFAVSGCERRDKEREDVTGMRDEGDRRGVGTDVKGDTATDNWEMERKAFDATLTSRFKVLDARVDGLDDQIDALTGGTKKDLETSYDAIKDRRDKLKDRVKDIRDVKKDQWSTWRMEVNRTFETLEADVTKLEQQIKSGKTGPS